MSPVPDELIDRWENRVDASHQQGMLYWHVLLGDYPQVQAIARRAQERLSEFPGLHMTPLQWLHITTLVAGSADGISHTQMKEMIAKAAVSLSDVSPITIYLDRVLYHPEAIMLAVRPDYALNPVLEAARSATRAVIDSDSVTETNEPWVPHVTLCYSTQRQPAEPIIAALGKNLSTCKVTIDALSMIIQRGPERRWDWHPVGAARLLGP